MSYGGDTAEMMVKEGIEITEAAVKLAALGMKNLAALVLALAKDEHKVAGLTNIGRMLKDGSRLKVFDLKSEDIGRFTQEAKSYGVLFTIIDNPGSGMADVVVREGDVQRVCRIFERIGYSVPQEGKEDVEKKENARAPQEKKLGERGTGLRASAHPATTTEEKPPAAPHRKSASQEKPAAAKVTAIRDDIAPKPSVVSRMEAIKRARAALDKETATIKPPVKVQTGPVK